MQKITKSLRAKSLSSELLLTIGDLLGTYEKSRIYLKFGKDGAEELLWRNEMYQKNRTLKRLSDKKLLKYKKIGLEYEITLTEEGKYELLRQRILNSNLLPKGQICMVIFDIPESQSNTRKILRRFLDAIGFIPIQKSVWISPFDAGYLLRQYLSIRKKNNWIRIYNAQEYID